VLGERIVEAIGLALALIVALRTAAMAATLTVNTLVDESTPGDGLYSLREAMTNALSPGTNTTPQMCDCPVGSGTDTINFSVSLTISLARVLPPILHVLTIDGTGQTIIESSTLR
jgi:hypothetical protein